MAKQSKPKQEESKGLYLIILTEFKEIFAGWSTDNPEGDIIKLAQARQVVYYSADTKGLLGLAANGPGKDSRVSNECPQVVVRKPVNVLLASDAAIERFKSIIW